MGACNSQSQIVVEESDVDRFLREEEEARQKEVKILLLGAGESGKSTVIKQCKMLYIKGGMTKEERHASAAALKNNALETIATLCVQREKLGIELADPVHKATEASILEQFAGLQGKGSGLQTTEFSLEWAHSIFLLWQDAGIQATYARRDEYHLLDCAQFYLDECERFAEDDFEDELTEEDLMSARMQTIGVEETTWHERDGDLTFKLIDVAGQRSARKKWIQWFDDVKALLFLAGLSGYSQRVMEDASSNRLQESLDVFEEITKLDAFKNTPVFLFLNKKDLFETVLKERGFGTKTFTDYKGEPHNMHQALEYIKQLYVDIYARNCPGRELQTFVVAARLRMDMKLAFGELKQTVKELYKNPAKQESAKSRKRALKKANSLRGEKKFEGTKIVEHKIITDDEYGSNTIRAATKT